MSKSVDVFLDWRHKVKSFSRMYEVFAVYKLQFEKSKLTRIALIWWSTYKKGMFKFGNGNVTTWGEMKVAIKKRFAHRDYK